MVRGNAGTERGEKRFLQTRNEAGVRNSLGGGGAETGGGVYV